MNNNKLTKQNFKTTNTTNMNSERISLTMAPGGENNRGMEIIGRMPIKGEGFTSSDIEGLGPYFEDKTNIVMNKYGDRPVSVLDLNALSLNDTINDLDDDNQARVLILRDWAKGLDKEIYNEVAPIRWDAEYLDPNKYRTEIVDGVEVKVRGKRMNKRARTNLCFVADREQKPSVYEGKGTIYDLKKMNNLNKAVETLRKQIEDGLIEIGSETKVIINVVEGNRYYDLKKTGIGFHGDTERVVVICLSIGGWNYPMRWQWFKDGMPIGNSIDIHLNSGDVYIMSEKAVGADWKLRSKYTLRHSAGAEKYRSLKKWEKRAAKKAELKDNNKKVENKKENNSEAALKKKEAALKKKEERDLKKKIRMEKALERKKKADARALKLKEDKEANPEKYYKKALKKLSWDDSRSGFYEWLAVQAEHECAPEHDYFKDFQDIWTGKAENFSSKMDTKIWEKHFNLYIGLCKYSDFM